MEINFLSKVYSKSLLKVESLKGSVVYSLILDYQFCACVMQVSGIPQLQVMHMEHLYGYNGTWHLNLGKSGQDSTLNNVPNTIRLWIV